MIKYIFNNYETVYGGGPNSLTQVQITPMDENIILSINQSVMSVTMNSTLHIMNPFNLQYDAAIVNMILSVDIAL